MVSLLNKHGMGFTSDHGFSIVALSDVGHCCETVAQWHHQQWLQQTSKLMGAVDIAARYQQRLTTLREHAQSDGLPNTWLAVERSTLQPLGSVSVVEFRLLASASIGDDNDHFWLTNLFVRPQDRQRGLGSQLLAFAVQQAAGYHLPQLRLYTHDQQTFYRDRDWHTVGESRVQGQRVTIMCKPLG